MLGLPLLAVAAALAYVSLSELDWVRGRTERAISSALGRDLTIDGSFEVDLGRNPGLTATGITLANVRGGQRPLARVERFRVAVDPWSLVSGPVRVTAVELAGVRVSLEVDSEGRPNWELGTNGASRDGPRDEPLVIVEDVDVRDAAVVYREADSDSVELAVERLRAQLADRETIGLRAEGRAAGLPFRLSGTLSPASNVFRGGGKLEHALAGTIADADVVVRARVAELDGLTDPEIELDLAGSGVAAILAPLGIPVASDVPFRLSARWGGSPGKPLVQLAAVVGDVRATVEGSLTGATDLRFAVRGRDLSRVGAWTGADLPKIPFRMAGHVVEREGRVVVENVEGRLHETGLRSTITLGEDRAWPGTKIDIELVDGRVSDLASRFELPELPFASFDLSVAARVETDRYRVDRAVVTWGGGEIRLDGSVNRPFSEGLDLTVDVRGSDASSLAGLTGVAMPGKPYAVRGRVERDASGVRLHDAIVEIGNHVSRLDGSLGTLPDFAGLDMDVAASTPDLSDLEVAAGTSLPQARAELAGSVAGDRDALEIEDAEIEVGEVTVRLAGRVGLGSGGTGTSVDVEAEGPSMSAVADLLDLDLPGIDLPAVPFSVSAEVGVERDRFTLAGVVARWSGNEVTVAGTVPRPAQRDGIDLSLEAHGPEAASVGALVGLSLPPERYSVAGGVATGDAGLLHFDDLVIELGGNLARMNGTWGQGGALDIRARGPGLRWLAPWVTVAMLPDEPWEVSGRIAGTARSLDIEDLAATVGGSDLGGALAVDLDGTTAVRGELRSRRIDVTALRDAGDDPDAIANTVEEKSPGEDGRSRKVLSDSAIDPGMLETATARVRWHADEVAVAGMLLRDLEIGVVLENGRLRVDPLSARGAHGGSWSGAVTVEGVEDELRVAVGLDARGMLADLSREEDGPEQWPTVDAELDFDGRGSTPRRIVTGAEGRLLLVVGEGRMDRYATDLLTADLLIEILSALNPFDREDPYTLLECAVVAAKLEDGVATLDPMALRTEKMTVVGDGRIDFSTEEIELSWTTRPRSGIGLSASAITNPYVKVGGTLSEPSLDLKPLSAIASTGAAGATSGLSILVKGLWDRIAATRNVCKAAMNEVEERTGTSLERFPDGS